MANTSIWHDEAFVALNVLHKSFGGLLGPLDWHEASPPGFLILEKFVASWLGESEYVLRLVPLLGGIAGMAGFALLSRQICGEGAAPVWAALLMAASAKLIVQSNEIKHFTLDVLWAILILWSARQIWHRPARGSWLLLWGTLGAIGLWLSYASLFVFAGTSLVLLAQVVVFRKRAQWAAYLIANFLVLVSVVLLWQPIQAQMDGIVLGFWNKEFPDTSGIGTLFYWFVRAHLGLFNYFWQPLGVAIFALALLGTVRGWQMGRKPELACLLLPIGLALVASFLHRWPFGGNQHMVFAAPAVLLLAGWGTEALRAFLAQWRPWVAWAFVVLLMLPGFPDAAYRIVSPRHRYGAREVVEFVKRHQQVGDQFIVFDVATTAFYGGQDFLNAGSEPRAGQRIWYVGPVAHARKLGKPKEVFDRLSTRRTQLGAMEAYGAAAYLFAPEPTPDGALPNGR